MCTRTIVPYSRTAVWEPVQAESGNGTRWMVVCGGGDFRKRHYRLTQRATVRARAAVTANPPAMT